MYLTCVKCHRRSRNSTIYRICRKPCRCRRCDSPRPLRPRHLLFTNSTFRFIQDVTRNSDRRDTTFIRSLEETRALGDGHGCIEAFCYVTGVFGAVEEVSCFCCIGGEDCAVVSYTFGWRADAVGTGAGVEEGDGCLGFCVGEVGDLGVAGVSGEGGEAGWCKSY